MDASSIVTFAIAALAIWFVPKLLFESVGRASDGISQLFVPPDRTMGWPHGVQESDDPWGWRGAPASRPKPPAEPVDPAGSVLYEVEAAELMPISARGELVVSLRPVRRN